MEDISKLIRRAVEDKECGMGAYKATITEEFETKTINGYQ